MQQALATNLGVQDIERDGVMSSASVLFPAGARPGKAAVRELAARDGQFAISLDPGDAASGPDGEQRGEWLELVINGLTFDLTGLAPGPAAPPPPPPARHLFGLPADFSVENGEALALVPGPHLAGGGRMMPVLRAHALLASRLAALPGASAIAWHSAGTLNSPEYFRSSVTRWAEGGAFPGLGLAALVQTEDGVASEGLELFTGQELRISADEDRADAARIALRLMHWLVENGPLDHGETLTGPSGEHLRLEPSSDRRFIKVWKT